MKYFLVLSVICVLCQAQVIPNVQQTPLQIVDVSGTSNALLKDNEVLNNLLMHAEVKNRKIVVVTIVGLSSSGKSFFMNYCLRFMRANYKSLNFPNNPLTNAQNWMGDSKEPLTGFSWTTKSDKDTKGVVVWPDVFLHTNEKGENLAIILADTQGLFDGDQTVTVNIFSFGTLMSSMLIYNIDKKIREDQLSVLKSVIDFAKETANDSQNTTAPYQNLIFLIRDFMGKNEYGLGLEGGSKYLNYVMKNERSSSLSGQTVRDNIFNSYESLSCFLMPYPSMAGTDFVGQWSAFDSEFKDQLMLTISTILKPSNLKVKKIAGHSLTAREFKYFLGAYLSSRILIGSNSSSSIDTVEFIYNITIEAQTEILLEAIDEFILTLNKKYSDLTIINLDQNLQGSFVTVKKFALNIFTSLSKVGTESQQKMFYESFIKLVEIRFITWRRTIEVKYQEAAEKPVENDGAFVSVNAKQYKEIETELIYARNDIRRWNIEFLNMKTIADTKTREVEEANREILKLKGKIDLCIEDRATLTKTCGFKDQEIGFLKQQLENRQSASQSFDKEKLDTELFNTKQELALANSKLSTSEISLTECNAKNSKSGQDVSACTTKLEQFERDLATAKKLNSDSLKDLEMEKSSNTQSNQQLSNNLANVRKQLEECQKKTSSSKLILSLTEEYVNEKEALDSLIVDEFEKYGPVVSGGKQKFLYISRNKETGFDNAKTHCQNRGMTLATFDSYNDGIYLDGATKYNTWVGIQDKNKNGQFLRITDDKNVRDEVPWGTVSPVANKYCVHSWIGFSYTSNHCDVTFHFACEAVDPQTLDEAREKVKILKEAKEKKLLESFSRHVTSSNGKTKIYYISTPQKKLRWSSAFKFCADIKMNLATFDSTQEAEYFNRLKTQNTWVGIRDNMKNGRFLRVTDGADITKYVPFRPGQPNGNRFCVLSWDGNRYADQLCSENLSFACETFENT